MPSKLKRSELTEEIRWVFKCPECKGLSESSDDPECSEYVDCEHCDSQIDLEN